MDETPGLTPRGKTVAYGVLYGVAGLGAVIVLAGILAIYSLAHAIRDTQTGPSKSALQILLDCTTSTGKCYQHNVKNQANALADLHQFTIYAVACGDRPGTQTINQIQNCAVRRLEQDLLNKKIHKEGHK